MAIRTTSEMVEAVIEVDSAADLDPLITAASALTDYIASADTLSVLTSDLLLQIETYIAAHLYALKDPQYQTKATGGASATFQGQTKTRFEATWWGQQAMVFDVTGKLAALNAGTKPVLTVHWLGKSQDERINWWDR